MSEHTRVQLSRVTTSNNSNLQHFYTAKEFEENADKLLQQRNWLCCRAKTDPAKLLEACNSYIIASSKYYDEKAFQLALSTYKKALPLTFKLKEHEKEAKVNTQIAKLLLEYFNKPKEAYNFLMNAKLAFTWDSSNKQLIREGLATVIELGQIYYRLSSTEVVGENEATKGNTTSDKLSATQVNRRLHKECCEMAFTDIIFKFFDKFEDKEGREQVLTAYNSLEKAYEKVENDFLEGLISFTEKLTNICKSHLIYSQDVPKLLGQNAILHFSAFYDTKKYSEGNIELLIHEIELWNEENEKKSFENQIRLITIDLSKILTELFSFISNNKEIKFLKCLKVLEDAGVYSTSILNTLRKVFRVKYSKYLIAKGKDKKSKTKEKEEEELYDKSSSMCDSGLIEDQDCLETNTCLLSHEFAGVETLQNTSQDNYEENNIVENDAFSTQEEKAGNKYNKIHVEDQIKEEVEESVFNEKEREESIKLKVEEKEGESEEADLCKQLSLNKSDEIKINEKKASEVNLQYTDLLVSHPIPSIAYEVFTENSENEETEELVKQTEKEIKRSSTKSSAIIKEEEASLPHPFNSLKNLSIAGNNDIASTIKDPTIQIKEKEKEESFSSENVISERVTSVTNIPASPKFKRSSPQKENFPIPGFKINLLHQTHTKSQQTADFQDVSFGDKEMSPKDNAFAENGNGIKDEQITFVKSRVRIPIDDDEVEVSDKGKEEKDDEEEKECEDYEDDAKQRLNQTGPIDDVHESETANKIEADAINTAELENSCSNSRKNIQVTAQIPKSSKSLLKLEEDSKSNVDYTIANSFTQNNEDERENIEVESVLPVKDDDVCKDQNIYESPKSNGRKRISSSRPSIRLSVSPRSSLKYGVSPRASIKIGVKKTDANRYKIRSHEEDGFKFDKFGKHSEKEESIDVNRSKTKPQITSPYHTMSPTHQQQQRKPTEAFESPKTTSYSPNKRKKIDLESFLESIELKPENAKQAKEDNDELTKSPINQHINGIDNKDTAKEETITAVEHKRDNSCSFISLNNSRSKVSNSAIFSLTDYSDIYIDKRLGEDIL